MAHAETYRVHHPRLAVSGLTVFEILDGLYREGRVDAVRDFVAQTVPTLDVIYPDETITLLGAEINAALSRGRTIGVVDVLIAATAISQGLVLVTGNTGHLARVQAAGFPLRTQNWREPGPFPRV